VEQERAAWNFMKSNAMDSLERYREFLKDNIRRQIDFSRTDQNQGIPAPPIEKPYREDARRINLIQPGQGRHIRAHDLSAAIAKRQSRRIFLQQPLSLEELSFLLWATQGLRGKVTAGHAFRTVPSAGCRHALETYLVILRVNGLDRGVYRYLPVTHQLLFEFSEDNLAAGLVEAALGQTFTGKAAVTFVWAAVPYRMEWRYGMAAHKVIAIDAGHVCQNLYLACEAVDAGACAIAAYDQPKLDALLRLDGKEEFAIYLATVGKVTSR
jgi:SagB-type dehydrogenase family enzyme